MMSRPKKCRNFGIGGIDFVEISKRDPWRRSSHTFAHEVQQSGLTIEIIRPAIEKSGPRY